MEVAPRRRAIPTLPTLDIATRTPRFMEFLTDLIPQSAKGRSITSSKAPTKSTTLHQLALTLTMGTRVQQYYTKQRGFRSLPMASADAPANGPSPAQMPPWPALERDGYAK